ncbi:winged-helix domain-containing protein [Streptomyces sp. NPDC059897]|uniref:winged helix-turn-helix transcriptional regulator n=1 Tax=Streptomyces sp. NPDC059897 TaxID=3346994 RepID=UPI00365C472F
MTPEVHRPPDLLLADPDEESAAKAMARFEHAGVRTIVCRDGAETLLQVGAHHPRAVLLAAPLPVVDVARVTELIARLHPVPVLVAAGPKGADEATAAVTAGAVAFVARPYRVEEILPFVISGTREEPESPLVVGDIELDPAGFHVYIQGRQIYLPVQEFRVLRYLMEHANRVVTRQELVRALWGTETLDSNTLTVHVRRIRVKLRDEGGSCCTIEAIRGMGYRMDCGPAPART